MTSWKKLKILWDLHVGRYEVRPISEPAQRDAYNRMLAEVRVEELKRHAGFADDVPLFTGYPAEDVMYCCTDTSTGQLVAGARATAAGLIANGTVPMPEFEFDLPGLPEQLLRNSRFCHRLVVRREARATGASLALLRHMYAEGLRNGVLLTFLDCEPQIYPLYLRMGFRPVTGTYFLPIGGFWVAMVMINHDIEHLTRVRSPLAPTFRSVAPEEDRRGIDWYEELQRSGSIPDSGFAAVSADEDVDMPLLEGVSEEGRTAFLENAHRIVGQPGDTPIIEGDGATWMVYVESGLVEIKVADHTVAMCGSGQILGEVGFILGTPRTARTVVAAPDTELLVLSQSALRRVEKATDRERLWKNLATAMAWKFHAMNQARS